MELVTQTPLPSQALFNQPRGVREPAKGPTAATMPDGSRLHLQHGPIDLIIEASGKPASVASAYRRAWIRFGTILDELVAERDVLRRPLGPDRCTSPVGRRMANAVAHFEGVFVTPMSAVAGAVADEIRDVMVDDGLTRLYVNNGGDIALHLVGSATFDIGLVPVPHRASMMGKMTITAGDPVRGVATSGRHGRSHSLGIADAVTTLADTAALADVAATLLANAVDLPGHPAISRTPANEFDDDSDLDDRLVTTGVGALSVRDVADALNTGANVAHKMRAAGSISAAVLCLHGQTVVVGSPAGGAPSSHQSRTENVGQWS